MKEINILGGIHQKYRALPRTSKPCTPILSLSNSILQYKRNYSETVKHQRETNSVLGIRIRIINNYMSLIITDTQAMITFRVF